MTQLRGEASQDALNFPGRMDNQLVALYSNIVSLERKLNTAVTERYADIRPQIENLMERVLLFADGPRIEVKDLPEGVRGGMQSAPSYSTGSVPAPGETPLKDFLKQRQAEIEKSFIVQALAKTEGNVTRAAKLLQISRKSLQTKMKEFGLRDEEPVAEE